MMDNLFGEERSTDFPFGDYPMLAADIIRSYTNTDVAVGADIPPSDPLTVCLSYMFGFLGIDGSHHVSESLCFGEVTDSEPFRLSTYLTIDSIRLSEDSDLYPAAALTEMLFITQCLQGFRGVHWEGGERFAYEVCCDLCYSS